MISAVRRVGIYGGDQDRAKHYCTASPGVDLMQDTPQPPLQRRVRRCLW